MAYCIRLTVTIVVVIIVFMIVVDNIMIIPV